jgi:uncharacterized protein
MDWQSWSSVWEHLASSVWLLPLMIFAAASLYASVGHGGASGYLAAMALIGVTASVMRPTALVLNVLVSLLATVRFYRAGAFSPRLFGWLALTSVPCAFLGGAIVLPQQAYRLLLGAVLVYAAWRTLATAQQADQRHLRSAAPWVLLLVGAGLGLLSGLTGVGGGIFLSPLLFFMRWAEVRTVAGTSAAFILVNSIAGLAGLATHAAPATHQIGWLALAAFLGGLVGTELGSRRLGSTAIQRILALVLLLAGAKMLAQALG